MEAMQFTHQPIHSSSIHPFILNQLYTTILQTNEGNPILKQFIKITAVIYRI